MEVMLYCGVRRHLFISNTSNLDVRRLQWLRMPLKLQTEFQEAASPVKNFRMNKLAKGREDLMTRL